MLRLQLLGYNIHRLGFNTRYYGVSINRIIKQQYQLLKSLVEVGKNLNLKPEQAAELSSSKLFSKIELIIMSIIWIDFLTLIHQTILGLRLETRP